MERVWWTRHHAPHSPAHLVAVRLPGTVDQPIRVKTECGFEPSPGGELLTDEQVLCRHDFLCRACTRRA